MAGLISIADKDTVQLRFKVGDRVECNCGTWAQGTIVKLFYAQKSFPEGKVAPYQIRLDDGRLIYSPMDEDRVIRKIEGSVPEMMMEEEEEELKDEEKLPVTLITGFLGAGKTTLVNYILKEQHEKKICVIENEFGEVPIDEALVKENVSTAEEIITMDNGCACCSVRGDLVKAFNSLKSRRKDFDLVVIETTGLADPAPIIKTISSDFSLQNNFRIDGVVCLVDCKHILTHLNETREEGTVNEAVQQVAFSDRILLNKTDLVSNEQLRTVKETIFSINSFAEQTECLNSRAPLDKLMGISSFSLERFDEEMKEYDLEDTEAAGDEHGHGHQDDHSHGGGGGAETQCGAACEQDGDAHEHGHAEAHEHGHAEGGATKPKKKKVHDLSGVGSISLKSDYPLISKDFNHFMMNLLQTKANDIYRSKGVLQFSSEGDKKYIFQGVHEDIQFTEAQSGWEEGKPRTSIVVFIGRNLDYLELRAGFDKCIDDPTRRQRQAGSNWFK